MNSDFFTETLKHIKKHINCSIENKLFLILDNHRSHMNVACLQFCKANGIIVLSLPPHCSHKMQPLDVGVFSPLKTNIDQSMQDFMLNHPGDVITTRLIAKLTRDPIL